MNQSSYELVKNAIEFTRPQRIPYSFDENRRGNHPLYGDDFIWLFVDQDPDFTSEKPGQNEFGIIYETVDESFGQPKHHPLSSVSRIDRYELPDLSNMNRYLTIKERMQANPDKYALAMFPHFLFQFSMELFPFENLMMDFMTDRPNIEKLFDRLMQSCISVIKNAGEIGVHGLIAIEDLGLQDRLSIPPQLWREIIKPRYKTIIDFAHKLNMHIFIHSCGNILEIIPDLIEIDLDVLQIDQQDNMGMDRLSKLVQGKICLFSPPDIQTIMAKPDNFKQIETRVFELITKFGTKKGGFIAKMYPQPEAIGIDEKNNACMCKAFKKYNYK
jgi:uroporphyrinogen decarboxylase